MDLFPTPLSKLLGLEDVRGSLNGYLLCNEPFIYSR